MGKGRIVSGGTDGLYTVELLHNRERIDAEIAFLTAKLAELQDELDALETEREGLVAERNAIATDIDTAVANAEEGEIPDVEALLVELAQVSAKIQQQDVRIAMIRGRMLEARKRKEMLEAIPADPQQQAWCADFTEDLTGEVGTVELPGEAVVGQFATWRRVIIRPGFEGRADYLPARDGQLFHREGQVGYQAYFNAAILPGWQKWKPLHRIGLVSTIDREANTCTLNIRSEDSSANNLQIDQSLTLSNVPFEYMDCNHVAFEVGDLALVEFTGQDWNSPKVIGFEKEPKPCLPNYIVMATSHYIAEANSPIPVYNLDEDEIIETANNIFGAVLFRTTNFLDALVAITWEMPPEYTGSYHPTNFQGLFARWSNYSLRWDQADFYFDTVGEDVKNYALDPPDEMATGEIVVIDADTGLDFTMIREGGTRWIRSMEMTALQIPRPPYSFPIYEPVPDTTKNLYRYTIDASIGAWSTNIDKRIRGSYKLEVVANDDIETTILTESSEPIPATLTIRGVEYYRRKIGKVQYSEDLPDFRRIAVCYAREGVPDPTYAAGFWKEEPEE